MQMIGESRWIAGQPFYQIKRDDPTRVMCDHGTHLRTNNTVANHDCEPRAVPLREYYVQ